MKIISSEDHRKHFPKGELFGGEFVRPFECPERWEHIVHRLKVCGLRILPRPIPWTGRPVRKIHTGPFLEFLENAWAHVGSRRI